MWGMPGKQTPTSNTTLYPFLEPVMQPLCENLTQRGQTTPLPARQGRLPALDRHVKARAAPAQTAAPSKARTGARPFTRHTHPDARISKKPATRCSSGGADHHAPRLGHSAGAARPGS